MITKQMITQLITSINIFRHSNLDKENLIKEISLTEELLSVKLPRSYKLFMGLYGHTMFEGFEIKSLYSTKRSVVETTLYFKDYDLPKGYIVIESDGADWVYCLDTLNMKDGECPVLMWVIGSSETHLCRENFYEFLKEQISEYYNVDII